MAGSLAGCLAVFALCFFYAVPVGYAFAVGGNPLVVLGFLLALPALFFGVRWLVDKLVAGLQSRDGD